MVDTDDTRRTPDAGHRTTPQVWHKLPTGELKTWLSCSCNPGCGGGGMLNFFLHCMGPFEKSVLLPPIDLNGTTLR